ncbi:MAG: poly-gamma-glutamate biosynthesis protein PgsC [Bacillota bacterium]
MISLSIGISLIASFLYTELTGLLAGGLVVPGYLALYLEQPARIGMTILIACATYLVVQVLSRFVILYGRRRFMAMVLVGFWLGWLAARYAWRLPVAGGEDLRAIGYIIPGLIANDAAKQGLPWTVVSVLLVSAIVRLTLLLAR